MKRLAFFLVLAEFLSFGASANPGDTTWVTVWNQRKLTQYGNYDTSAVFPTGKRYRKIRLHYILGRYACPGSPQYCGSWDYTTQIFARPANNDSVEIARVITPYASDWLNVSQGINKSHDYVVEVTDYASILDGPTGMRFNYSGYSWGFTITLKIEFIEGVPPMDALKVRNVYHGYFAFGNTNNPIENYLTAKTFTYGSNTGKVFLKNTVSGHGSDGTGCSEFCNKWYQLNINNNGFAQRQLWRMDCGENQVYPQTGTWIYNRGNWCPGAVVWPIYHDLTQVTTANTQFTVDINMQPYTATSNFGGYNYETQLITYSAPNHSRDVSIEDIMAPTKDPNYFRQNPRCAIPLIRMKNTGTSTVTSIGFAYAVQNGPVSTYTWTGSLNFLDTMLIPLPPSSAMFSGSVSSVFNVSVTSVNGQAGDDNTFNNTYSSAFNPVQIIPKSFVIRMNTNNNSGDNMWNLYDENDFAIVGNQPLSNNSLFRDTINLLPAGCYRFTITDFGCDGLQWWANSSQGAGSLRFERLNGQSLYTFPTDFGCSFTKYFVVLPDPPPPVDTTYVAEEAVGTDKIDVYPNPAAGKAVIKIDMGRSVSSRYDLMDVNGRIIISKELGKSDGRLETVDISGLSEGVYFVKVTLDNGSTVTRKLMVQK